MRTASSRPLRRPRARRMLWVTASWGACFLAIRWGLRDAPALWFASLRGLGAGVALLGLAMWQRRPSPRGLPAWRTIVVLAVFNGAIAFAAMFAAVSNGSTGTAAVLANAQPLLILLPAWWLYGEAVSPRTVGALVLGFVGLVVVAIPGGGGRGAALALVAAAAMTVGTLGARRIGDLDLVIVSGWQFAIGGVLLAVVAALSEGTPEIRWTTRFLLVLAFLSLIGTAASFVAWFDEALSCRLAELTAWTFLVPVFGVLLGALVLDEHPDRWSLVGLLAVLASLWLVQRSTPRDAGDAPPRARDEGPAKR